MSNMIDAAKRQLEGLLRDAYLAAVSSGQLPGGAALDGASEIPRDRANGDFAATHALAAAGAMRLQPRAIAQALVSRIDFAGSYFESCEVAGPGFMNFTLSDAWYIGVLRAAQSERREYGRTQYGGGERVMVEFVSANPTGPMTIGNARGGVLGDVLASVLDMAGYTVSREFYVNDAGNQVALFGKSVDARYMQLVLGEAAAEFPENGYHGEDIMELAMQIYANSGDSLAALPESERVQRFIEYGIPRNTEKMRADLERYRIRFDEWFPESRLHESGYVAETVELLRSGGLTYEKDGALWLRNTALGADKDEVLLRANGYYTYYAADMAYHRDKIAKRGFSKAIDVWGADHHGHAIRFKATMTAPALQIPPGSLEFLIMQMVRLTRGG
ncbi:MAG: arginine--tRNA ligase, partial [Oscillospiraceae bacterium]|nr:arginine--tRNA ligase [Oscillospiraceae bacterium]